MAQEKVRPTLDEEIRARVERAGAPDAVIAKVRTLLRPAGGAEE